MGNGMIISTSVLAGGSWDTYGLACEIRIQTADDKLTWDSYDLPYLGLAEDPALAAKRALELAEASRKKGLLGVQAQPSLLKHNSFLERGMHMIIDGTPHEEVERIMHQEIGAMMDRHLRTSSILPAA